MSRLYGPYTRKDGRKHVIIVSSEGKKRTVSYPKFLLEQSIGRHLLDSENAHHKDENFQNDGVNNLEVKDKVVHARDHALKQGSMYPEQLVLKCVGCGKKVVLNRYQLRNLKSNKKKGRSGPFCSRSCSGKYS